MLASELRIRITLKRRVSSRSESGSVVDGWENYRTVRAGYKSQGGNEVLNSEQVVAVQNVRFKIRFDKNIQEDWIVEYAGQEYNIKFIEHAGDVGFDTTYLHCERERS